MESPYTALITGYTAGLCVAGFAFTFATTLEGGLAVIGLGTVAVALLGRR